VNVVNDLHVIAEALQRLDAALHSSRLAPPRRRVIILADSEGATTKISSGFVEFTD
jgi:hypothetical protein